MATGGFETRHMLWVEVEGMKWNRCQI